jgi:hypothetical protein
MYHFGKYFYEKLQWKRYLWWGRAAVREFKAHSFRDAVLGLLVVFERCEHGRILHTVAPVIRAHLHLADRMLFGASVDEVEVKKFTLVLDLHDAMLGRARRAIACWSMAARRLRVVKDIRVMIAKMAWELAWMWGENSDDVEMRKKAKTFWEWHTLE